MRVQDLIKLLEGWQEQHGPDAQISVPRSLESRKEQGATDYDNDYEFGKDIVIHSEPICTYLDSTGPEVEW